MSSEDPEDQEPGDRPPGEPAVRRAASLLARARGFSEAQSFAHVRDRAVHEDRTMKDVALDVINELEASYRMSSTLAADSEWWARRLGWAAVLPQHALAAALVGRRPDAGGDVTASFIDALTGEADRSLRGAPLPTGLLPFSSELAVLLAVAARLAFSTGRDVDAAAVFFTARRLGMSPTLATMTDAGIKELLADAARTQP